MMFVTIPVVAWVVCGTVKFGVNVIQYGYAAFNRIGHGGFPSNHTAIVSSIMWALLLTGKWHTAGLALAVLMISVFDAMGLRREVGRHATAINQLTRSQLREITGHSPLDIVGGLMIGLAVAVAYWSIKAISYCPE